jgi:DedD protein
LQEHLKERLTGAAILVAVVVLLVPEMFRGRPAGGADSHAAIADGAPIRTYTIDLRDSPTAQPPAVLAPAAAVNDSAVKDAPSAAVPSPGASPGAPPAPAAVAPAAASPSSSAPPALAARPVSSPATRTHPAGPKSGWTVQVASFTRRDFADRMVKQVRAKGFAVQAVGPDEHGLYRVRSAPISERATALALKDKMRSRGLKPIVNSLP